jgi:hypothetical protein
MTPQAEVEIAALERDHPARGMRPDRQAGPAFAVEARDPTCFAVLGDVSRPTGGGTTGTAGWSPFIFL